MVELHFDVKFIHTEVSHLLIQSRLAFARSAIRAWVAIVVRQPRTSLQVALVSAVGVM